ncbi:galactitol-1-phosphate 5-dehydrogenase [Leadbettera azotonutricia]|uniref:Sorbitol dehydrogenase (L-iditol 2-dehydrogenase)(Glucitol dehydrogenase) n=1 Tax=Leadbettera azotonutricia (strain ATCC BAA-888 / DSM 13862 / ZAS-9) TaxID=545695 RepID=F5YCC4_LEAAZ|nr:galactitol-1-phosphate 5-dehydrogenase [Leadbettera azotonutricia]AEF80946.1 sorbitol dehydrogenase (L-iditol 2-dehydrogenase)(Glucitol dehydrogenase) [Leadbettera azotonutricia ZAS-9]
MKNTMMACNLHGIGDLRYEEVPMPKLEKDEVLLEIKAAGICGSDIPRVFEKGTYHFPTIPGHEFAGTIVQVNPGDESLIGKAAAVFPLIPCGKCEACQIGEYAQCHDYDYYGSRRDGAFAEYIAVKKWNLVFVPESVSLEHAAMCEPCAVAIHALSQVGIGLGDTVAIFGAGTIGLLAAQIAKGWGASQVVLADVDKAKLDFARELGFTHIIDSKTVDPAEYIKSITANRGADAALEAAGVSATVEACLKSVKTFGKVALMGNPAKNMDISQKAYWEILRKQLTLKGTWNSGYNDAHNDWRLAIKCMENGVFDLSKLITHRFSLAECGKAFDLARKREEFWVKIMFVNKEQQ